MTRRLTIDDATGFAVPAALRLAQHDTTGTVTIIREKDGWSVTYIGGATADHRHGWSPLHLCDSDEDPWGRWRAGWYGIDVTYSTTAQAALDAAIAAGAVIDEGDQT